MSMAPVATADDGGGGNAYLTFVRAKAATLQAGNAPPRSLAEWTERRARYVGLPGQPIRVPTQLLRSIRSPTARSTATATGSKVTFQTSRPDGHRNLYLPKSPAGTPRSRGPATGRASRTRSSAVRARCGGFAVLAVDAFGAGEQGIGKALGEYHGEMTAATLLPTGQTLAGLQVYENSRALAYLATRPEVDAARVGVTGASGGGNQTMYAIAMIDGLKAAVPVCSVGNYRSYLGTACCMCELVPGALTFTEEWGVLGLAAPKPLMVINATRDAVQFSVSEARKTITGLEAVYAPFGHPRSLRHAIFESGHDYNKAMREAAYGWFAHHLAGRGDGSPIAEPAIQPEDSEALRCFPGDTRPDDFMTLPKYAAAEGRRLSDAKAIPSDLASWKAEADRRRAALATALGGFPELPRVSSQVESDRNVRVVRFEPEPGLRLSARVDSGTETDASRVILLDLDSGEAASASALATELRKAGRSLVTLDLRGTGRLAVPSDRVGHAPDHNSAQWGLWIGRPLLGQWVYDVRRLLDALDAAGGGRPRETVLVGVGAGGLVALAAAAVDPRVSKVAAVKALASYVSDEPHRGQRLGVIVPGLLRDVGDIPHLAALVAPRRVVIAGAVSGGGQGLDPRRLLTAYEPASRAFRLLGSGDSINLLETNSEADVAKALR